VQQLAMHAADCARRVDAIAEERDAVRSALAELEASMEAKRAQALAAAAVEHEQARAAERVHPYLAPI